MKSNFKTKMYFTLIFGMYSEASFGICKPNKPFNKFVIPVFFPALCDQHPKGQGRRGLLKLIFLFKNQPKSV